jgi:hypothetical protein
MRIFSTGTMRAGGSLLINILSLSPRVTIFNERLNFFRFVDGRYDLFDPTDVKKMLDHFRIRLKYRSGMRFDSNSVYESIKSKGFGPKATYDEVMSSFLPENNSIWGEYANLSWRNIPEFLGMFHDGKVIHVMRDPRGVLASFKHITFLASPLYLFSLFHWIDSAKYASDYKQFLDPQKYYCCRLEDFHSDPGKAVHELCGFLEIPVEPVMLQPERWEDVLDESIVKVNISAYDKKKVFGFDQARSDRWREKLAPWEVALTQELAGPLLEYFGYEYVSQVGRQELVKQAMRVLRKSTVMEDLLNVFLQEGESTDSYPIDPTLPENWSASSDGFKKFVDTPEYQDYIKEIMYVGK